MTANLSVTEKHKYKKLIQKYLSLYKKRLIHNQLSISIYNNLKFNSIEFAIHLLSL